MECDYNHRLSYKCCDFLALRKDHENYNISIMTIGWNEPTQQERYGLYIRKYLLTRIVGMAKKKKKLPR